MKECPLCHIPENEELLYRDNDIYLVRTKDMKGHKVRVMCATRKHMKHPTFIEKTKAYYAIIDYMQRIMGNRAWFLVDCTFASNPEHFHIIACDTEGTDEELKLLLKTPKVKFPLKAFFEPLESVNFGNKKPPKVMIGIPAYNEEKTIGDVIAKAKKYGDVVVLNDGSTDDTAGVAYKSGAYLINMPENYGYGTALSTLFYYANAEKYDVLVTLDADGQHNPLEIPNFLSALEKANVDIVIGNRFFLSKVPMSRAIGIHMLGTLTGVVDSQCGFRAYNRKAIETLELKEEGMGVSLEILHRAKRKGLKIAEIPCRVQPNKPKRSLLKHGGSLIETLLWLTIWDNPIKFLGIPAFILMLLGIFSTTILIQEYVKWRYFILSWAILGLGGLLSGLLLGITSVLIWSIKRAWRRNE